MGDRGGDDSVVVVVIISLLLLLMGRGCSLVDSAPFVRRVAGSNSALAAM